MGKKYLVVLKNPATSFMVDSFEEAKFLKGVSAVSCVQENNMLWIPISSDSNIAYVMEMSEEDVEAFEEQIANVRNKIVKPKFVIPKGKQH